MNWRDTRTATPKPAKGSDLLARHTRKRAVKAYGDAEKQAVRGRDGNKCRWPGCRSAKSVRLEVAHLNDKKMGGDHGLRSSRDQMMLLCFFCHQGPFSLHSKDKRIEPIDPTLGTNGPCAFYERQESGQWQHVFSERGR